MAGLSDWLAFYHVNENDRHLKFNQFSCTGRPVGHRRANGSDSSCGTRMEALRVERRRRRRHDVLFNLL